MRDCGRAGRRSAGQFSRRSARNDSPRAARHRWFRLRPFVLFSCVGQDLCRTFSSGEGAGEPPRPGLSKISGMVGKGGSQESVVSGQESGPKWPYSGGPGLVTVGKWTFTYLTAFASLLEQSGGPNERDGDFSPVVTECDNSGLLLGTDPRKMSSQGARCIRLVVLIL